MASNASCWCGFSVCGARGGAAHARNRLQSESRELAAGQSARSRAGFRQRVFERGEIVLPGMKLQIRQQLALRLGDFLGCPGHEFHPQPRGGRPQRIALGRDVFRFDEALLFERPQHGGGLVHFLREIGRRERPAVEHAENRRGRVFLIGSGQVQLARRIASRRRERVDAAAPDVGRQRRHRAQGLPERGAIVRGNPASEVEEALHRAQALRPAAAALPWPDRLAAGCGSPGPRRSACAIRTEPESGIRAERAGAGFREACR